MTRARCLATSSFFLVLLSIVSSAPAYFAGGGKDAQKNNDCLIGYNGLTQADLDPDATKPTIECTDCDPACDLDGDPTANGSCLFKIGVCLNQEVTEEPTCTPPPNGLSKATAKFKAKGKGGARGEILLTGTEQLMSTACVSADALQPFPIILKKRKDGTFKPNSGTFNLSGLVNKDKVAGTPKRKDKDKLTYVCLPRTGACPAPTTTSSTSSTSTTIESTTTSSTSSTSTTAESTTTSSTSSTSTTVELSTTTTTTSVTVTSISSTTSTTATTSTTFPSAPCGNHVLDPGEQCDYAGLPSCGAGQVCDSGCQCEAAPVCGDGSITPDAEACDPAAEPTGCDTGTACRAGCTSCEGPGGCAEAVVLPPGGGTVDGTTSGASQHAGTCGGAEAPEAVFAWTPEASGYAEITTCDGTGYDTLLYVRSTACVEGEEVACNDDSCELQSRIVTEVTSGETYYIFVDGDSSSASGAFTLRVTPLGGSCGDGTIAGEIEACDPAAQSSGCDPGVTCVDCAYCAPPCGNGVPDPDEQCDPYGPPSCEAGQVCDFECQCRTAPVCGDGTVAPGLEACDPTAEPSGCAAGETCIICTYCALPCGNGILDPGEQCDPYGPPSCGAGQICDFGCQCQAAPVCGDGTLSVGFEACDPTAEPSGCDAGTTCIDCIYCALSCGNGVLDPGEQCDPYGSPSCEAGQFCDFGCQCQATPVCGDGTIDPAFEACDTAAEPSGCDAGETCIVCFCLPPCGNGVLDPGEQCDYSGLPSCGPGQVCDSGCQCEAAPVCGDGTLTPDAEVCDPAAEPTGCDAGSACTASCSSCEGPGGCAEAVVLPPGGGTVEGATSGASQHAGTCGGAEAPEAVFAWTPEASGYAEITTCDGADHDTLLYVRSTACVEGEEVACNDDSCELQSRIVTEVTSGETYYIFVDGYSSSASGAFTLRVTPLGGACGDGTIAGEVEACDPAAEPSGCDAGATCVDCADCAPPCGNGVPDPGEQCDPSGPSSCEAGQFCDSTCQCQAVPVCGDGTIDPAFEACDPTAEPSGCDAGATCITCTSCLAPCGNGVLDPGEQCDPFGFPSCGAGQFCDFGCQCQAVPVCGDGTLSVGFEACDPTAEPSGCDAGETCIDCAYCAPPCGNGVLDPGEQCDPNSGEESCASGEVCGPDCTCQPPVCGNFVVEPGEECDGDFSFCNTDPLELCLSCRCNPFPPVCGDGIFAFPLESCDPNAEPSGCETGTTCVDCSYCAPPCGNGVLDPGEQCDPYGPPSCEAGQVCDFGCQCQAAPVCGDGTIDPAFEACDPAAEPSGCDAGATCIACFYCLPSCGNGVLDPSEQCDYSALPSCGPGQVCDSGCQCDAAPVCGDGTLTPDAEVCDPAAEPTGCDAGSACTASCSSCEGPGGCAEAVVLPPGGGTVEGATSGASQHAGTCGGAEAPEAVFAWTPEASGYAEITTCDGADHDTLLYVRSTACVEGEEVACNDDSCELQSRIVTEVTSGETYYIFVDGYSSSASGAFTLRVTPLGGACGDGTIAGEIEACDPAAEPSGCDAEATCVDCLCAPPCGNGVPDPGEQCDPGAGPSCEAGQVCDSGCQCQTAPVCGDGTLAVGLEACDPAAEPSGCETGATCVGCFVCWPQCGNGALDPGEQCDPSSSLVTCGFGETCNSACVCEPAP